MWMVEELTQILREMLLEGDIQNIVVFTVITSSSVLSVVGVLRHIYVFICNHRHGEKVDSPPARSFCPTLGETTSFMPHQEEIPFTVSSEKLIWQSSDPQAYSVLNREHVKKFKQCSTQSSPRPTCLKCDEGMWDRHCVYGLCQACCERLGGCQHRGHSQNPVSYDPWCSYKHKSERTINLSKLSLQELPPRLGFHHMDASSLDVSYNCLTCLPTHVTLMRGLVSVSLRHNQISDIPAFFACLHQLAYLDLRNNRLSTFPDSLLELPQLLKLYLDHNSLTKLPRYIDRLHFLQCLSLGYNNLTRIPHSLFNIQGLKSLNLRGNDSLSFLPSSIGSLICLQRLDISYCDLRLVPQSLGSCTVLRKCNISHNRLVHLPCEISQCYRLTWLDVSHNRLLCLPATLLFRQGILTLIADENNFIARETIASHWSLIGKVVQPGTRHVPTLTSMAAAVVDRCNLDSSRLPLPIQEELYKISSCYHCGQKKATNSIRAVKFSNFKQGHPRVLQPSPVQEYPFLYTFCHKHIGISSQDSLEACLNSLILTHEVQIL